jgi:hypothetical protein
MCFEPCPPSIYFPSTLYPKRMISDWYWETKMRRVVESWQSDIWPWTWNSLPLCISWTNECFGLVFAGMMHQSGDEGVSRGGSVALWHCGTWSSYLWPLNSLPLSISLSRTNADFGLVCSMVVLWPLTLAQCPLTLKFPSDLYLLNECRFWILLAGMMYLGTNMCHVVASWHCDLWPWPIELWSWNSLPLWTNADFGLVFEGWCIFGTRVCCVMESWWCDLAWKYQGVTTFHLCHTY